MAPESCFSRKQHHRLLRYSEEGETLDYCKHPSTVHPYFYLNLPHPRPRPRRGTRTSKTTSRGLLLAPYDNRTRSPKSRLKYYFCNEVVYVCCTVVFTFSGKNTQSTERCPGGGRASTHRSRPNSLPEVVRSNQECLYGLERREIVEKERSTFGTLPSSETDKRQHMGHGPYVIHESNLLTYLGWERRRAHSTPQVRSVWTSG